MAQPPGTTRFSININEMTAEQLQSLKQRKSTNTTATVERAILLFNWFEEAAARGDVIKVLYPNGDVREIVFI